jgi:prolyl 4-hydroxylase
VFVNSRVVSNQLLGNLFNFVLVSRQRYLSCGPRILTFFLYLSDVEEGGETSFPSLGIDVKPRKGSALLWPSTLSDSILDQDPRTEHEAKPVIRGVKLAANSWIHSHDFQKSNLWGCTGSFDYL